MTNTDGNIPQIQDRDFVLNAVRDAAERQVEDRVYERIKGDLLKLKFLGFSGGVIILIAVYFHQAIFSLVVDLGSKKFLDTVDSKIDAQRELLAKAESTRNVIQDQIKAYLDELSRHQTTLSKLSIRFEEEMGKLDNALRSAQDARNTIDERIQTAQSTAQSAIKILGESAQQINGLQKIQEKLIDELKSRNVVAAAAGLDAVKQPLAVVTPRPTVYFQFAGFKRDDAVKISKEIEKENWSIPGQERTALAADPRTANHIRFNSVNRSDAERLQNDANQALRNLGFNITLELEQNALIKPGILEIWIFQR